MQSCALEKEEAVRIHGYFKGSIVLQVPVTLHCSLLKSCLKSTYQGDSFSRVEV